MHPGRAHKNIPFYCLFPDATLWYLWNQDFLFRFYMSLEGWSMLWKIDQTRVTKLKVSFFSMTFRILCLRLDYLLKESDIIDEYNFESSSLYSYNYEVSMILENISMYEIDVSLPLMLMLFRLYLAKINMRLNPFLSRSFH